MSYSLNCSYTVRTLDNGNRAKCVLAYSLLTLKLMLLTPAYTIKKAYGSVKKKGL